VTQGPLANPLRITFARVDKLDDLCGNEGLPRLVQVGMRDSRTGYLKGEATDAWIGPQTTVGFGSSVRLATESVHVA